MKSYNDIDYIKIPKYLSPKGAINCASYISSRPNFLKYYYDFSNMQHCPPFGLLAIANAIRKNMSNHFSSEHIPVLTGETQGSDYAASLGFYQMMGWTDIGQIVPRSFGNYAHIPITKITIKDLQSKYNDITYVIGEMIDRESNQLAVALTQNKNLEITKALQYCIREIIRNTFEHGKTDETWICGQYWPTKHRAEIAIMDEGQGIKKSLQSNPRFHFNSDEEANKLALQPGVSRMVGLYQDPNDEWQNSGYGLYVSSSLCLEGGHFILMSGSDATFMNSHGQKNYNCNINGTIICLSLDADKISDLPNLLKAIVQEGSRQSKMHNKERILTASKVSTIASIMDHIKRNE